MRRWTGKVGLLALALTAACAAPPPAPAPSPSPQAPPRPPTLGAVAAIPSALVPNLRRVSERLYSSGRPEGEAAFRALAAEGIRTVVCVDAQTPDVEAARRAGIRYVHLPFGYAGVPRACEVEIARLATELPGPILFHCHHGTQRAPTAAAIARRATEGAGADEALSEMRRAGLDEKYRGLAASVVAYEPPTPAELEARAAPWAERVAPRGLVETMLELDRRVENVEKGRVPEGDFGHETLLVREALVEAARTPHGAQEAEQHDFAAKLEDAIAAARALEATATPGPPTPEAIRHLRAACARCHEAHRDH